MSDAARSPKSLPRSTFHNAKKISSANLASTKAEAKNLKPRARKERADAIAIRTQIKEAAEDLLIKHGLIKMTLAMVAERLQISRPTIHYYYSTKSRLAEAVLEDYVSRSIKMSQEIWLDPENSIGAKFAASLVWARRRYERYSGTGTGDWSLFSRFYQELELMTPSMVALMKSMAREQQSYYAAAINIAKARQELSADTPATELALQIVAMLHHVGWLTWASGSFKSVETIYATTLECIERAYGNSMEASRTRQRGSARK
ncbi:MAG TPA: TetR/AcrR family transcriptional regulator [Ramlibacter sp.]|uniref:TetR/AcrR family transcriptional regulator n=1 Tax=Ramlibacter sp. TaxID=1917967 RepID=UPI002BB530B6|nr:TetR/AcrR family transcriptional regulator [Ramlibacter sp.]HVZ45504.1 TetR/AcrR family transcriptional regulator [Ramlibacter sp.]